MLHFIVFRLVSLGKYLRGIRKIFEINACVCYKITTLERFKKLVCR